MTKTNIREAEPTLDMQKLLQDIVPILFGKKGQKREHLIDNFVFRLHYRVTTAGLVAAAVLVSIIDHDDDDIDHDHDHDDDDHRKPSGCCRPC